MLATRVPHVSSALVRSSPCRPSILARRTSPVSPLRPRRRAYSTSPNMSGSSSVAPPPSSAALAPFLIDLDRIAPRFTIQGDQIRILRSPAEFYETLKTKIRGAERRIFLSTLYIGKSETELVSRASGDKQRRGGCRS